MRRAAIFDLRTAALVTAGFACVVNFSTRTRTAVLCEKSTPLLERVVHELLFSIRFGIVGIRVRRVTKVHNRCLRNRFDERLETIPQFDPTHPARSVLVVPLCLFGVVLLHQLHKLVCRDRPEDPELHFLFWNHDPNNAARLLQVVENGFVPSVLLTSELNTAGVGVSDGGTALPADTDARDSPLELYDSLAHFDWQRIASLLNKPENHHSRFVRCYACLIAFIASVQVPGGHLLIVKAYLGQTSTIKPNESANLALAASQVRRADYPKSDCVFQEVCSNGSPLLMVC